MNNFEIKPNEGANKNRKRVGRGTGNGMGKTCTRGNKGQKSRSGGSIAPWFEGGQMPLYRRLPKRGFKNLNKVYFNLVNLSKFNDFAEGAEITAELLKEKGMISKNGSPVKILGEGELTAKNLKFFVNACSKSAEEKIKASGGSIELV